jgi:hypothetical protein
MATMTRVMVAGSQRAVNLSVRVSLRSAIIHPGTNTKLADLFVPLEPKLADVVNAAIYNHINARKWQGPEQQQATRTQLQEKLMEIKGRTIIRTDIDVATAVARIDAAIDQAIAPRAAAAAGR